ncbi:MAG: hypothetical protein PHF51_00765 [Candidatus ainarchaeum sp.]|nr:hypothetical protein [Candidatus ainarchaeum sp.]
MRTSAKKREAGAPDAGMAALGSDTIGLGITLPKAGKEGNAGGVFSRLASDVSASLDGRALARIGDAVKKQDWARLAGSAVVDRPAAKTRAIDALAENGRWAELGRAVELSSRLSREFAAHAKGKFSLVGKGDVEKAPEDALEAIGAFAPAETASLAIDVALAKGWNESASRIAARNADCEVAKHCVDKAWESDRALAVSVALEKQARDAKADVAEHAARLAISSGDVAALLRLARGSPEKAAEDIERMASERAVLKPRMVGMFDSVA